MRENWQSKTDRSPRHNHQLLVIPLLVVVCIHALAPGKGRESSQLKRDSASAEMARWRVSIITASSQEAKGKWKDAGPSC